MDTAPLRVSEIRFGMFSEEEMRRAAHLHIFDKDIYHYNTRNPHPHGVLDERLGTSTKTGTCGTCGLKLADCPGHFGFINLELPCFHVGFFRTIIEVLQRVCKTCSKVLVTGPVRQTYLNKFRNPRLETLSRRALYRSLGELCKKTHHCPHCNAPNGSVKKIAALKLIHEKYKVKHAEGETRSYFAMFSEAVQHNKEMETFLPKISEDLPPTTVLELFRRIPPEDCELLDLHPELGRPERMILTHLMVPPVCIRPSVINELSSGSNEDDLTMKLREIIQINNVIRSNVEKGSTISTIVADWDFLQMQVAMYINSELPGFPPSVSAGKPIRSLSTRLKGKRGRFRGNLSGKRVDFSARTVISPDPNVEIDEVVVPELIAKTLTFPERANPHNLERLRKAIVNGPDQHPGANFVEFSDGTKKFLRYGDRTAVAERLQIGDKVERHLMNGDPVLFNRQPSLHRVSIMSHRVRVLPYRTFRFNVCCCAPYNADFDGDEMNLHVPQTEEARAEASELMGVLKNLQLPKSGEPGIAPNQDFLTAAYLLTRKDKFFDRGAFCQLISHMNFGDERIDLPPPVIVKPIELWTGKQVFSVLIRPSKKLPVIVNMEVASKNYSKSGQSMCKNDGYVIFHNSELLCGTLDKSILGGGSKASLFYVLMRENTSEVAARCMGRLAKLTSRWLMNQGFSIGIGDVTPSPAVRAGKQSIVTEGKKQCEGYIGQFASGKLQPQPGCDSEQTLESILNGTLSQLRDACGRLCIQELPARNAPLTMALSGSKGSNINISQMIAVVGQQTVNGTRIPNGFLNRTLPHFPRGARTPAAKGFVENSFFTGLTATEFFFHTMAGREGLVDTAVKTAETGYMQRRLMKALEDLSCKYDYTIRNSENGIVQFRYGDDGLSPLEMEGSENKLYAMERLMLDIRNKHMHKAGHNLLPAEIRDRMVRFFANHQGFFNDKVADEINKYMESLCANIDKQRQLLGLPLDRLVDLCGSSRKKDDRKLVLMEEIYDRANRFNGPVMDALLESFLQKYQRAMVEPGEAVGALGAQSIGEPGTQMTLKTFHFAGVASMNVTLGVPRIKEIINASKNISTPIITAELVAKNDAKAARIVKGKIEKTMLGEISEHIREVYTPSQCYLSIVLDGEAIENLLLDISADEVRHAVLNHSKLKLKEKHVRVIGPLELRVYPPETSRDSMFHSLQNLKNLLPHTLVKGFPTIGRAVVINRDTSGSKPHYHLLVEGTDLLSVMGTTGVDGVRTKSNHVMEVEKTLGIEAARSTIMSEIKYVMNSYGMNVDDRHVMLLADVMTFRGEVLGITRFGIGKMKDSVLMLASFEKTTDHLFDAAVHGRVDPVLGVSECIITGSPIPLGTGSHMFSLVQDWKTSTTSGTVPLGAPVEWTKRATVFG